MLEDRKIYNLEYTNQVIKDQHAWGRIVQYDGFGRKEMTEDRFKVVSDESSEVFQRVINADDILISVSFKR